MLDTPYRVKSINNIVLVKLKTLYISIFKRIKYQIYFVVKIIYPQIKYYTYVISVHGNLIISKLHLYIHYILKLLSNEVHLKK